MKIHKAVICLFRGHDVYPEESIVADVMIDKRNWLCECHRCGLYVMKDGAISGMSATVTKRDAYKIKEEFEKAMSEAEIFGGGDDEP